MARTNAEIEQRRHDTHGTSPNHLRNMRSARSSDLYRQWIAANEPPEKKAKLNRKLRPLDERADPNANYLVGGQIIQGKKFADGIRPHNAQPLNPQENH